MESSIKRATHGNVLNRAVPLIYPESMRDVIREPLAGFLLAVLGAATQLCAQQAAEPFRWVDFHSEKEQDTVAWVTRSLAAEKWTAIREIGVEYDAALVVTTLRPTPQSAAGMDTFTVWSASLTNHGITPLLKGVNLRLLDTMNFREGAPPELGAIYDDCNQCAASTFFTSLHYDFAQHTWAARWMRGGQAVPIETANVPPGVSLTQVYAVLGEPNGTQLVGTWSHFDYGNVKPPEDFVYRYDLDPFHGLDRTQILSGKDAGPFEQRLCRAQDAGSGPGLALARGQDSPLCQQMTKPHFERKPVTTPPANNHGQSAPPKGRR